MAKTKKLTGRKRDERITAYMFVAPAVILLIALWNYSLILDVLGQGVGIVYPFLLGGAIAFVINVPMSFLKKSCFKIK